MVADIAGYSALMERDESRTFVRLLVLRDELIVPRVTEFGGRIIKTTGDGFLAEFPSATAALGCGVAIQRQNFARESTKDTDERFHLRMGVNLGDIIIDGEDVSGDGVNIAARLEPLAPIDGLCISGAVRDQVREDLGIVLEDLGEQRVKNIARPIRAYRINIAANSDAASLKKGRPLKLSRWKNSYTATTSLVIIVIIASIIVWFSAFNSNTYKTLPLFDAMSVPFASDAKRKQLQQTYPGAANYKAIAVAFDAIGMSTDAPTEEAAKQQAMDECRSFSQRECFIYAVGMHVIWSRKALPPLPLPVDINIIPTTESLVIDKIPTVNLAILHVPVSSYINSNNDNKTMAIGANGALSWTLKAERLEDSVRHTLQLCSFWTNSQCLLIAKGDQLTQPLPRAHRVKAIFLFSSDSTIPSTERDRLEKVYQGKNWRAIASGQRGTWEAVSEEDSENEAVSAAIQLCEKAGDICHIFAIGNFLVDEN
jgi:adenylate cyclase